MTRNRLLSLVALCVAMFAMQSLSAQLRSSYFMEGSYFRTELNPALVPTRGYVALPGIGGVGANISSNFLSVEKMYSNDGGELSSIFHAPDKDMLKALPATSKLNLSGNVNLFGLGFYSRKTFWTLGVNARVQGAARISGDFFGSMMNGGEVSNTNFHAQNFYEVYLGSSFRVHRNANVGIRAKFLMGGMNIYGDVSSVERETSRAIVGGRYTFAGPCVVSGSYDYGTAVGKDELFNTKFKHLTSGVMNVGVAFDLGTEIRFCNDHLKFSAAVTDLGFIDWDGGRMQTMDVDAAFDLSNGSIDNLFKFENAEVGYKSALKNYDRDDEPTMLNYSVNIGLEYNFLHNHFALGVMSHNEFCNNKMQWHELTASFNIRPTNWLTATVSKTLFVGEGYDVWGLALNIHPRAINIFVGADFLSPTYVQNSKGAVIFEKTMSRSLYAGVGFNFMRPKHIRMASATAKAERKEQRKERKEER